MPILDGAANVAGAIETIESHLHPEPSFDVAKHPMPTGREEIWRFSPLKALRPLLAEGDVLGGLDWAGDLPDGVEMLTGVLAELEGRLRSAVIVDFEYGPDGLALVGLEQMRRPVDLQSPNLRSIVERIRPGLVELVAGSPGDEDELLQQAVRANIRASVQQLRHGSRIIESLIDQEGLRVVGARYSLATGVVDYLEDTL